MAPEQVGANDRKITPHDEQILAAGAGNVRDAYEFCCRAIAMLEDGASELAGVLEVVREAVLSHDIICETVDSRLVPGAILSTSSSRLNAELMLESIESSRRGGGDSN